MAGVAVDTDAPVASNGTEPTQVVDEGRRCEECGQPLPADADYRRRYCGRRCRNRASERHRDRRVDELGHLVEVLFAAGATLEVDVVELRITAHRS